MISISLICNYNVLSQSHYLEKHELFMIWVAWLRKVVVTNKKNLNIAQILFQKVSSGAHFLCSPLFTARPGPTFKFTNFHKQLVYWFSSQYTQHPPAPDSASSKPKKPKSFSVKFQSSSSSEQSLQIHRWFCSSSSFP